MRASANDAWCVGGWGVRASGLSVEDGRLVLFGQGSNSCRL